MDFETRLEQFVALCQEKINKEHSNPQKLTIDPKGKKYKRIVIGEGTPHCSVYCFVAVGDSKTKGMGTVKAGDVLKSASWKTPAKGARGNIFDEDNGTSRMSKYGAAYNN